MFELWTSFPEPPLVPAGGAAPLISALLGTARTVAYACDARASGVHMSAVQAQLAAQLSLAPRGLPSSELAERLGVTKQAVTGLVARMEYADLALRTAHPFDGRCTLVRLTERGARELVGVARRLAAFDREIELALGTDPARHLKDLLRQITEDARGAGLAPPPY